VSRRADEANSDRIARADSGLRPPLQGDRIGDDAILANPGTTSPLEALRASRCVARYTMLRSHGCRGLSCSRDGHGADRDARDLCLRILGLDAGPEQPGRPSGLVMPTYILAALEAEEDRQP
jgi:hypothetical protein